MRISGKLGSALLAIPVVLAVAGCGSQQMTTTTAGSLTPSSIVTTTAGATPASSTSEPASVSATIAALPSSDDGPGTVSTSEQVTSENAEAQVGGWEVKVLSVTLDADEVVANHSEFNQEPEAGTQYVLITVQATRTGEGPATFADELYSAFIGSAGDTFEAAPVDVPDSLNEVGETQQGASVTANLVFRVASDQVEGGRLVMQSAGDAPQVLFQLN